MSTTATSRRRGPRPRAPKGWMFERPRLASDIHARGAQAAKLAVTNRKATAARMGLKPDVVDKIIAGDPSSRLRRYDEFFVAVQSPFALIEHHEVLALRSRFGSWDRAQCVARLNEIRADLEPLAHAKATGFAMQLKHDCRESRRALREALHAENTLQREMQALLDRLDEIDAERPA